MPPMHPILPGDRRGPELEQKRGIRQRIKQRIKLRMEEGTPRRQAQKLTLPPPPLPLGKPQMPRPLPKEYQKFHTYS